MQEDFVNDDLELNFDPSDWYSSSFTFPPTLEEGCDSTVRI